MNLKFHNFTRKTVQHYFMFYIFVIMIRIPLHCHLAFNFGHFWTNCQNMPTFTW